MLVIDLNVDSNGHPGNSVYLAFEHGHVGVVSTSGVFVFTTDASYHSIPGSTDNTAELARSPFPSLLACRAIPFDDEVNLGRVSCLQMTDSRLFLTYDPNITRRFSKQRELDTCSTAATMTSTEAVSPTSASASEPIAWENTEYMNAEEQPMPIMHTNATEAAHDEGEPPDVIPFGDIHVELADADGDEDEDVQAGDDEEEEEEEEEDSDNDDIFHHFNQPDPKAVVFLDFSPNNEYMYRV
ncbi:hypothetical protein K474DRAFT_1659353 [Panus rudis PR-1116 ss-1]|nr:hypothetical protein K474DRAFT_1659353 [Panus rudis PR-1116 ss-1]